MHKLGRRRLLAGVGASGLAAAIAVFGRGAPASAANYGCCSLIFNPPNMSLSACQSVRSENEGYYTWYCSLGPSRDCACCEHYRYGRVVGSAGICYYS